MKLRLSDNTQQEFIKLSRSPFELGRRTFYMLAACVTENGGKHGLSGMDSDLEAFSHYPTDGSFAALSFQTTALTKYLNELFLSY